MKKTILAPLAVALLGAGDALADEKCDTRCGPTVTLPNVKLYRQLPPDAPTLAPTTSVPGPTFYRAEVKPPRCLEPVTLPAVTFFCGKVTDVTFTMGKPPPVRFFKAEVKNPECLPSVKLPGLTFFRQEVRESQCAPSVALPNVGFYKGAVQPGCTAPTCVVRPQ